MSPSDETTGPLADAGLLFQAFIASPWRSLEVAHGALHLSISRLSPAEREAHAAARPALAGEDARPTMLTAPHIATVRALAAPGATVRAGEVYATLELLGEPIELHAVEDIRVLSVLSTPGALVDFATSLIMASATASTQLPRAVSEAG